MGIIEDMDEHCRLASMRKVLQAFEDGRPIVHREKGGSEKWRRCYKPVWNFEDFEYKVAPFEAWFNTYPHSVVGHDTEKDARCNASEKAIRIAVHMREVENDEG